MDYAGFLREVEHGRVPPVALLHGAEPRLLDDALDQVGRVLFPDPSLATLNREVFDAAEASPDAVVRSALTLPSLAPARLVAVKGAQALAAKQASALVEYCRDPSPYARLLLLAGEPLPPTHWLVKALPTTAVVEVRGPTGGALAGWLQARAREQGIELTGGAAQLLIRFAGEDLATLAGELEKAHLFAGPRARRIGEEEIRGVVGEHRVLKHFELSNAVERGERGRALAVLDTFLAAGEEPLAILGALTRQVRTLWQLAEWHRQGKSADEMSRLVRRPSDVLGPLAARAAALPAAILPGALARCWEVERRLKSGGRPRPELALLVADLCRAG